MLAQLVEHVRTVGRIADREGTRDGVGALRGDDLGTGRERRGDGRTARRLGTEQHGRGTVGEAEFDELVKPLRHLRELASRRDRHDDLVGRAPTQLLDDFEGQGLGTFGVVGPQIDVGKGPVGMFGHQLDAESVHVVVVALDPEHRAAEDGGHRDLRLLQVRGDDHHAGPTNEGRVRGDRRREVTRRRARRRGEAETARARHGDRHDPVLERARRIACVVLQPEFLHAQHLGEACRAAQWCPSGAEIDGLYAGIRKERRVSPHRRGTALD